MYTKRENWRLVLRLIQWWTLAKTLTMWCDDRLIATGIFLVLPYYDKWIKPVIHRLETFRLTLQYTKKITNDLKTDELRFNSASSFCFLTQSLLYIWFVLIHVTSFSWENPFFFSCLFVCLYFCEKKNLCRLVIVRQCTSEINVVECCITKFSWSDHRTERTRYKTEPARKSVKKGLTFTHAGNRKDLGK